MRHLTARMGPRTWRHRVFDCIGVLGLGAATLASQDAERPSSSMIVRQQLGSIADEACDKAQLVPKSVVAVSVEARRNGSLAENSFLAALQRKGFETYLRRDRDSADVLVKVVVLTDEVVFAQIRRDAFARTVQTEVEIRTEFSGNKSAAVLGLFKRVSRDTVGQKDVEISLSGSGTTADEESSFFQRLAGPLVVLASGILVVYLFFTVRS